METLTGSTIERRNEIMRLVPCCVPYFHPDYCNIMYQAERGGVPEFFLLRDDNRFVYYQYVKRRIADTILAAPPDLYDVITHFDYGGYYTNDRSLLPAFFEHFRAYCRSAGIVSEFMRFLPTYPHDYETMQRYLTLRQVRDHVYIDLKDEDFYKDFSGGRRNELSKSSKQELHWEKSEDLSEFLPIYQATMQRRNAHDYFFFGRHILAQLISAGIGEIWYSLKDGKRIGGCFVLKSDSAMYYFLSANSELSMECGSSTFLLYQIAIHYRAAKSLLYLGGGDEGVYKFKESFSRRRIPYHIGMAIHDEKAYAGLVDMTKRNDNDFFPKYREKII
jgi:hypothetical protein